MRSTCSVSKYSYMDYDSAHNMDCFAVPVVVVVVAGWREE